MKLVPKLTLAFIAVTACVLATTGLRRVRRLSSNYRAGCDRDVSLVAESLADAASNVLRSVRPGSATAMIAQAVPAGPTSLRVRWVCLGGEAACRGRRGSTARRSRSSRARRLCARSGDGRRYAYVPW